MDVCTRLAVSFIRYVKPAAELLSEPREEAVPRRGRPEIARPEVDGLVGIVSRPWSLAMLAVVGRGNNDLGHACALGYPLHRDENANETTGKPPEAHRRLTDHLGH
jgi:hypothetical protein